MAHIEHHYWPETGHSEYWGFSADTWFQIPKATGEEMSVDFYKSWQIADNAVAKRGLPPRVWI